LSSRAFRDLIIYHCGKKIASYGTYSDTLNVVVVMELSELNFILEASALLKEISFGVQEASLSQQLPCSPDSVFINMTSLEGDRYCIHLDMHGYEVSIN